MIKHILYEVTVISYKVEYYKRVKRTQMRFQNKFGLLEEKEQYDKLYIKLIVSAFNHILEQTFVTSLNIVCACIPEPLSEYV